MFKRSVYFMLLSGALLLTGRDLSADPQITPSAPVRVTAGANLSPEEMGQQLEKLLQNMVKTGNDVSKKAYGIDLEQQMGGAKDAQGGDGAAKAPAAGGTPGADGQMFQGILQNSNDMIGKSMGILGKMAEMDLKEMQAGEGGSRAAPQTESARKAEELTGLGTLKAMTGDNEGSISLFEQAIVLNPEYGTAYYNLACAYGRLGAAAKFAAPLRKAIALDGKYKGMAERDSDFDSVRKSSEYLAIVKR